MVSNACKARFRTSGHAVRYKVGASNIVAISLHQYLHETENSYTPRNRPHCRHSGCPRHWHRPFDLTKAQQGSGGRCWIGVAGRWRRHFDSARPGRHGKAFCCRKAAGIGFVNQTDQELRGERVTKHATWRMALPAQIEDGPQYNSALQARARIPRGVILLSVLCKENTFSD